jgi:hypothetical protein
MAGFPSKLKGNKKGETASQPRAGVPLDKNLIIECIRKLNGNVSAVADYLGSTRMSIHRRIEADPELQAELRQSRERQLDDLEKVVFERAQESNDTTLQLFILKTQGRHRGWEQDEAKNTAKDIATAAFDFIINKSKSSQ